MRRVSITVEDVRRWQPDSEWPRTVEVIQRCLGDRGEVPVEEVPQLPISASAALWLLVREEVMEPDRMVEFSVECADRVAEHYAKEFAGCSLLDQGSAEAALEAANKAAPPDRAQMYLSPEDMIDGEIEYAHRRAAAEAAQSLYAALSQPATRATAEMARVCACRARAWAAGSAARTSAWNRESERQLELWVHRELGGAKSPTKNRLRGVSVRLARDDEGTRVMELQRLAGFWQDWMTWESVRPYWIVAERHDQVIGCLMYSPGRPLARAEFLAVDPAVSHSVRAIAVRQMLFAASAQSEVEGSDGIVGHVLFKHKSFRKIAQRLGAAPMGQGHLMVKRSA